MNRTYKGLLMAVVLGTAACTKLEVEPKSTTTSEIIFSDPESYRSFLAKIYAGLAVSGQTGPAGNPDIKGIDEGFSTYLRQYWKAQELPTDEAVIAWGDEGLPDYHEQDWTAANQFVTAMYNRIFYQISIANQFLRETTEAKLTERGFSSSIQNNIQLYRAEARFLRALSYWHGIDMFGNIPLVTEETATGTTGAPQATRADLFAYVEQELKAIEDVLPQPKGGEYGRADQAAVWSLLAKLYLNAQVYTGQDRYTDCITYCNKIIGSGAYSLNPSYQSLFLADNQSSSEIIFSVNFDGLNTRTYGGMTFLVHAPVGGNMKPADYGIDGGWYGLRTTSAFVNLFPDETGSADKRAIFYTNGQSKEINSISNFNDGYAVPKFRNITSQGSAGSNFTYPDTDFPLFRLADVYLMYAEAVLRGGSGGEVSTATEYVNLIRTRAYGNASGNLTVSELILPFILAERGRELYWEAHRRTDLIRFGEFTDQGIWPWKGGVKEGRTTESFRKLFPIPSTELIANPNLKQNIGY